MIDVIDAVGSHIDARATVDCGPCVAVEERIGGMGSIREGAGNLSGALVLAEFLPESRPSFPELTMLSVRTNATTAPAAIAVQASIRARGRRNGGSSGGESVRLDFPANITKIASAIPAAAKRQTTRIARANVSIGSPAPS